MPPKGSVKPAAPASGPTKPTMVASVASVASSNFGVAMGILTQVGELVQNVPYVKVVAALLLQIKQMKDDLDKYKDEWQSVMDNIESIQAIVDGFHTRCVDAGKQEDELPEHLRKAFRTLESCMIKVLKLLEESQFKGSYARKTKLFFSRGRLSEAITKCGLDVQKTLSLLQLELQIYTTAQIHDIWIRSGAQPKSAIVTPTSHDLPSDPTKRNGLFGREREMEIIIDMVAHPTPPATSAHIAILGSGGIGKTSLAQAALHHAQVEALFHDLRYFVPCDAATSGDALLIELAKALGVPVEGENLQSRVLAHVKAMKCIICLDNFETPWEADTRPVEELLAKITAMPDATIIVTIRGAQRPLNTAWTEPLRLPPIRPLDEEATMKIFEAISGHSDDYALRLTKAVDCVPLAVTLLAHLAQSEQTEALWDEWNENYTSMVQRAGDHRLDSLECSIQMSLRSFRMTKNKSAAFVLSLLSLLPAGMQLSKVSVFQNAIASVPDIRKSLSTLQQCALAYSDNAYVKVLSPIRLYMQKERPLSRVQMRELEAYYLSLGLQGSNYSSADTRKELHPEVGNIDAILSSALDSSHDEGVAASIFSFVKFCQYINLYDQRLLTTAVHKADRLGFSASVRGDGHYLWAMSSYFLSQWKDAQAKLETALKLHKQGADELGQANDLWRLGDTLYLLGKPTEAEETLDDAYDLNVALRNSAGQGYVLQSLAQLHLGLEQLDKAVDELTAARLAQSRADNKLGQANVMYATGQLYLRLGKLDEAKDVTRRAMDIHLEVESFIGYAYDLVVLGEAYRMLKNYPEAEITFIEAVQSHEKTGDVLGQANALQCLGQVHLHLQDLAKAKDELTQALDLHTKIDERLGIANDSQLLGVLHLQVDEPLMAQEMFERTLERHREASDLLGQASDLYHLGKVHLKLGHPEMAVDSLKEAVDLYTTLGTGVVLPLGDAQYLLGSVHFALNQTDRAYNAFEGARRAHEEVEDVQKKADDFRSLGLVYMQRLELEKAAEMLTQAFDLHGITQDAVGQEQDSGLLDVIKPHLQTTKSVEGDR